MTPPRGDPRHPDHPRMECAVRNDRACPETSLLQDFLSILETGDWLPSGSFDALLDHFETSLWEDQ